MNYKLKHNRDHKHKHNHLLPISRIPNQKLWGSVPSAKIIFIRYVFSTIYIFYGFYGFFYGSSLDLILIAKMGTVFKMLFSAESQQCLVFPFVLANGFHKNHDLLKAIYPFGVLLQKGRLVILQDIAPVTGAMLLKVLKHQL